MIGSVLVRLYERLTSSFVAHPWRVVVAAAAILTVSLGYTVQHFAINTDTARLIASDTPWRKAEAAFDAAFPGRVGLIVAVIDAPSPEAAEAAAAALEARLKPLPEITSVRRPDAGPFIDRNGLLLLERPEFDDALRDLVRQQPFLSLLAADPSLGGVLEAIRLGARGVAEGEANLGDLVRAMDLIADRIEARDSQALAPLSWRSLLASEAPVASDLRRLVLIQPALDYTALQPGGAAIARIRAAAAELGFTGGFAPRLRLTGPVALADEEFATVAEGALVNTVGTIALVLGLLFAALRSWRLVLAVMITLMAGLVATAALGLALVGEYNLISVAFAVLFVGLGVDFSIQMAVRYRELRHGRGARDAAIREAAHSLRRPLTLAAASTATGFLAFLPTPFRGVSELGLIAGLGMGVAFVASISLLPALLVLLSPPPEAAPVGYRRLAGVDRFIERHRRAILWATGLVFVAGLPLLAALRFDSDPMNLRDERVESVATFLDLARDRDTQPQTLDVVTASPEAAGALEARLRQLPEVARAVSIVDFARPDQAERLAELQDAALPLDTVLEPVTVKEPRSPDALRTEIAATARALEMAQGMPGNSATARASAARLAAALAALETAPAPAIERVAEAATRHLPALLARIRLAFEAQETAIEDLPEDLRRDWLSADGRARVEVVPRGDATDPAVLRRFVEAVRSIAPEATGAPVTIVESGRTVVSSFVIAGLLALAMITLLLYAVLRHWRDVGVTLVPLVVAVLMSLQAAVLAGIALNFANIIALPLMCGVSVAFHIYFVLAWRRGESEVLASPLTRAVLFSALTTAAAFGALWLSSHPGTASMGKLLTLSLAFTLLAAFVFVPAFLGRPPQPAAKSE